ncbi:bifunctional tetrahydrofolate synthase/dihydrofolate synthase [Colwelliaceae bacterium 6471]
MFSPSKSHSQAKSLAEWLSYLETIHSTEIDLGLARIQSVATTLGIDLSFAQVITVAGTNGKGTTCAFLENALLNENKSVAVYSSPHIERFNERLRLNKQDVDDSSLVSAFEIIEEKRGTTSLTYYEYTTLAAFIVLMQTRPDFIILEVGLGGRLDATNIINANISVITTVDLDHQAFLGNDRESIGYEKAGIMRGHGITVVGDLMTPKSVLNYGEKLSCTMYVRERDFLLSKNDGITPWQWHFNSYHLANLHQPNIPIDNVATALTVLALLDVTLDEEKVNGLIDMTKVSGRTELFHRNCDVMLDVGHNPQAARYLAEVVARKGYKKVYAVVGMLADKDIENTLKPLGEIVSHWYLASLQVPRAADANLVSEKIAAVSSHFNCFDNVTQAFTMATKNAEATDLVLVFGSFYTVAEVRRLLV